MARGKRHTPEQIVNVLRQIEVAIANGKTTPAACKKAGFTEQTYYRRRKEYGGLKVDQAKRLNLIDEHTRECLDIHWFATLAEASNSSKAGGRNIVRAVVTGLSKIGRQANSPVSTHCRNDMQRSRRVRRSLLASNPDGTK